MQITVCLPNLSASLKTGVACQKTTKVIVVKYVTPDPHAWLWSVFGLCIHQDCALAWRISICCLNWALGGHVVLFLGWPDPTALLTATGLSSSASLCPHPPLSQRGWTSPSTSPFRGVNSRPKAITGAFGFRFSLGLSWWLKFISLN